MTRLDHAMMSRFLKALEAQNVPAVKYLQPGLTDVRIDELMRPTGLTLPEECRVWWRFADGVTAEALEQQLQMYVDKWWGSLEAVLESRERLLEDLRDDGQEPGDDNPWQPSFVPFTVGHNWALDVSQPDLSPVYSVDWHAAVDEQLPPVPSLGATVQRWTYALDVGAVVYEHDYGQFAIDSEKAKAHGIDMNCL